MRVLVTGPTGFIGSAVVNELLIRGHDVVGLARSQDAGPASTAAGVTPCRGSIEDLGSRRRGAASADAAVHTAYFRQFSQASMRTRVRSLLGGSPRRVVSLFLAATVAADRLAITTIGTALRGSDPAFVAAFGTLALTPGQLGTEEDEVDRSSVGAERGANETAVRDLADRGVRASVVTRKQVVARFSFLAAFLGVGSNG